MTRWHCPECGRQGEHPTAVVVFHSCELETTGRTLWEPPSHSDLLNFNEWRTRLWADHDKRTRGTSR